MDTVSHSSSSSVSCTLSNLNPEKGPIDDEGDSDFNLNHSELSERDQLFTLNFDFLDEVDEPQPVSVKMSPRTELQRNSVVVETYARGRVLFGNNIAFNHPSVFSSRPVNYEELNECVDLKNGYKCVVPRADDRVWMMLEFGMHDIPWIWFEFGLTLPMHPFYQCMYEQIGCGGAQLSPNFFI